MKLSISNLVNFQEVEIEMCERSWVHKYPQVSSSYLWEDAIAGEGALNEDRAVILFRKCLQKGIEDGKKIKIVRSSVDAGKEVEVLWSNDMGCEELKT